MSSILPLLKRIQADPAHCLKNMALLAGIFVPLGVLAPSYSRIAPSGVRLALLLAALACAACCLRRVCITAFVRLYGKGPAPKGWGRLVLAWLASALLLAVVLGLLGFLFGVPPEGAEPFFYALFYPALAAAMFTPVWQPEGGLFLCVRAWWAALRFAYLPLLVMAAAIALLNALAALAMPGILGGLWAGVFAAVEWALALELFCWFGETRQAEA